MQIAILDLFSSVMLQCTKPCDVKIVDHVAQPDVARRRRRKNVECRGLLEKVDQSSIVPVLYQEYCFMFTKLTDIASFLAEEEV